MNRLSVTILLVLSAVCGYCNDSLINRLNQIGLPVVAILTENQQEPTCEYVKAGPGAAGQTITNVTKIPGRCTVSVGGGNCV